jgi:alanyl-tRNA synthetase
MRLLEQESIKLPEKGILSGEVAFKLYDTYGFPLDLTQDILRNETKSVDTDKFNECMKAQRAAARASWSGSGEQKDDDLWFDIREKVGATDFLGYQTEAAEGQTMALVKNGKQVSEVSAGEVFVVTNQTPFYGESGGQMGDTGVLIAENAKLEVIDTLKVAGNLHVHKANILKGTLKTKDALQMYVDGERRRKLRANHSATHVLHEALRRRLGKTVTQKGSLVSPDRLRFDFSYPAALTEEDLRIVEKDVNHQIRMNTEVTTKVMHPDDAVKAGAMALFGEKYGDEVRVVSMGEPEEEKTFSVELCGGTHVSRLGDIGFFKIISESSVSAGVRRIEAVTREEAENIAAENQRVLTDIAHILKATPDQIKSRVQVLIEERKKLEKDLQQARQQAFATNKSADQDIEIIAGTKIYAKAFKYIPAKDLRPMVDTLKKKLGSAVILLISENEDKVAATIGVTEDLLDRFDAKKLITVVSETLGSQGGGGRPDMAQCGGNDASKIDAAIQALKKQF